MSNPVVIVIVPKRPPVFDFNQPLIFLCDFFQGQRVRSKGCGGEWSGQGRRVLEEYRRVYEDVWTRNVSESADVTACHRKQFLADCYPQCCVHVRTIILYHAQSSVNSRKAAMYIFILLQRYKCIISCSETYTHMHMYFILAVIFIV